MLSLHALLNLALQVLTPLGNSLHYIWACYPSLLGTGILDVGGGGEGGVRSGGWGLETEGQRGRNWLSEKEAPVIESSLSA